MKANSTTFKHHHELTNQSQLKWQYFESNLPCQFYLHEVKKGFLSQKRYPELKEESWVSIISWDIALIFIFSKNSRFQIGENYPIWISLASRKSGIPLILVNILQMHFFIIAYKRKLKYNHAEVALEEKYLNWKRKNAELHSMRNSFLCTPLDHFQLTFCLQSPVHCNIVKYK